MITAIYARKSTEQNGVSEEEKFVTTTDRQDAGKRRAERWHSEGGISTNAAKRGG